MIIRLWDLARPFIGDYAWNEVYYAYIARDFLNGDLLSQYDIHNGGAVYSTPLVPWLLFLGFKLFGVTEWAARMPILAFWLAALFVLYRLADILFWSESGRYFSAVCCHRAGELYSFLGIYNSMV